MPSIFIPRMALHQPGQFPVDRLVKIHDFNPVNEAVADSECGTTIKLVLRIATRDT